MTSWFWLVITLVSYMLIATLIITIARDREKKNSGRSKRSI